MADQPLPTHYNHLKRQVTVQNSYMEILYLKIESAFIIIIDIIQVDMEVGWFSW